MRQTSLEEILRQSFLSNISDIHTAMPCIVLGVHEDLRSQRVDVQPVINRLYKDDSVDQYPPILAVPVVFPASSTSALTFPINVGDTVLCVFSQRGLDAFKGGDGTFATPTDFRRLDKRDAIAIPGLFPFSKAINNPSKHKLPHNTKDTVLCHNIGTANEVEVRLTVAGGIIINAPAGNVTVNASTATVNCPNTTWNGNITMNGNYTISGTLRVDGVVVNGHVHGSVQGGNSISGGMQ